MLISTVDLRREISDNLRDQRDIHKFFPQIAQIYAERLTFLSGSASPEYVHLHLFHLQLV
jgi:hypothetical protein